MPIIKEDSFFKKDYLQFYWKSCIFIVV